MSKITQVSEKICRLCLSQSPEFDIFEDKICFKIMLLMSVEVAADDRLPAHICKKCRLQLEKFYIFRMKSVENDSILRRNIPQEDTVQESINFISQTPNARVTNDFNEHDYESISKQPKISNELSDLDYDSIEKTVSSALQKNGYNGRFILKIEGMDDSGLRKVKVIKDNGAVILMKLKMPEKSTKRPFEVTEEMQVVAKKCEIIETLQQQLIATCNRTEKTVTAIHEQILSNSSIEAAYEYSSNVEQDENSPFYFPITNLVELWRLNNKLQEPDVKSQLSEEMSKIEAPVGGKISGKILRTVIGKTLLSQICWSGRIKDGQKYVKSDERLMLSKMKFLVDWLFSLVSTKEPDTTYNTFLQTVMNILRKERFKSSKDFLNSSMQEQ